MSYFVYIITNKKMGTLYTGISNDLSVRIYAHKEKLNKGFSQKYNTFKLMYFEEYENIHEAISREKQIKNWKREWKVDLIQTMNPEWEDLYQKLNQ